MNTLRPYYEDPAEFVTPVKGKRNDYTQAIGLAIAKPGQWVAVFDEPGNATRQGAISGNLAQLRGKLSREYPHNFESTTRIRAGRVKGYLRVTDGKG